MTKTLTFNAHREFNVSRVSKRKELRKLMQDGEWKMLEERFRFKARFIKSENGKRDILDWSCIPQAMYQILQVGNKTGKTQDFLYAKAPKQPFPPSDFGKSVKAAHRKRHRHPMRSLPERVPIKRQLFESQNQRCFYCHAVTAWERWTLEHRHPISKGGTNDADNLCGSCKECNNAKGHHTEAEFMSSDYMKDLKPFIALENTISLTNK